VATWYICIVRYVILGDIHGNQAAFKAVLKDVERRGGLDKIWCLGDTVGYGPDPGECIEILRRYDHVCIAGNHDRAAVGELTTTEFNQDAAEANQWTTRQLTSSQSSFIKHLELKYEEGDFTLVHGSPREPIWEYLLSSNLAGENFKEFSTPYCLVGHSHFPLVFKDSNDGISLNGFPDGAELKLDGSRFIINPGSVGQPRDNDPRASYAIYDSEAGAIYHYRVEYDIKSTQMRMAEEGLPVFLIERLSHGW
jgi:diadenosine tetraphosphatase ApaH/serine/threonine PP2A family protein phosphatase